MIQAHKQTLRVAQFYYQVTFCETRYSHRYINFEIERDNSDAFDQILAQYIEHIKQWDENILLVKCQELTPEARKACSILSKNQQKNADDSLPGQESSESDDDDEESDGDEENLENEKAYTLAVVANTEKTFNEVIETWTSNLEHVKSQMAALSTAERPPMNRIIVDEQPNGQSENNTGFNLSCVDDLTGRCLNMTIGSQNSEIRPAAS